MFVMRPIVLKPTKMSLANRRSRRQKSGGLPHIDVNFQQKAKGKACQKWQELREVEKSKGNRQKAVRKQNKTGADRSEIKSIPKRKSKNRWKWKTTTHGNDKKMTTEARANLSKAKEREREREKATGEE